MNIKDYSGEFRIKDYTGKFSKKLTLAVTSILFLVITEWFGFFIEYEKLLSIVGIVITYLIAQGVIDVKKEANKNKGL